MDRLIRLDGETSEIRYSNKEMESDSKENVLIVRYAWPNRQTMSVKVISIIISDIIII
jgi:hypothetical protein